MMVNKIIVLIGVMLVVVDTSDFHITLDSWGPLYYNPHKKEILTQLDLNEAEVGRTIFCTKQRPLHQNCQIPP